MVTSILHHSVDTLKRKGVDAARLFKGLLGVAGTVRVLRDLILILKCTMHGTEPIILPFHDTPLNAAKWLRDIELRWPAHGPTRDVLPLFPDENGKPFNDATFSALIAAV
jgi:hypothetical protein